MSIARHHVEWLSLLEVSGPFLSLPVLMKTFPQGLEGVEPQLVGSLRAGYEEWQAGVEKRTPSIQDNWVRFVLRDVLGIPDEAIEHGQAIPEAIRATFAEHGETLRPDLVIAEPASKRRRLLIQIYPAAQDLEKAVRGKTWNASPATRMMELLHATGVRLGLVTNGERWMLVDAPRDETTGYASWYAGLWLEERITLQAFRSLFGADRFFNVSDDKTLESLLAESAENQQEVTDQLGYQVRKAVEVLVEALDRADQDHSRALLADVAETELYEAALTVMMRLVFLFCAEERGLLLLGEPLFDEHYAVSTLREQLREAADLHGEDVLERRHDAWNRLLATFRAVHGGIRHERLVIPPYGGTLLDPDRFPFLEGRKPGTTWRTTPAEPLPVNNRTVLHLLDALQVLQVRLPGGGSAEARKLSFRALDIEQIGYVYEGLLDHTAVRATEPILGLVGIQNKTKDWEAEVPLSTLEALRKKGEKELVAYLEDVTGRSTSAIEKTLKLELAPDEARRIQGACGSGTPGATLWSRLQPFAGLVRDDSFGYPLVIHQGSVYVTEGTDRRASGTQYTPRSLTEPVVQHALEPLVYVGPAEGWAREKWKLRSAREILALKLCDFACGSGAFLVQECRYLADRLLEAWTEVKLKDPTALHITPEGDVSQGLPEERLIPDDPDERLTFARRLVAQRCLYGVDVNPLAVEMAKLSLWLLTLAKDLPFTFLDHSIRCGDSLLGITSVDQLKRFSLAEGPVQKTISQTESFDAVIDDAIAKRLRLEAIEGNTVEHVATQKHLLEEAEEGLARLKAAADQLIAAEIGDVSREDAIQAANASLLGQASRGSGDGRTLIARRRRPFHWVLEFPEVIIERGGFDAVVGNPPFIGNKYWKERLFTNFQRWAEVLVGGKVGKADVVALFFRRAYALLNALGRSGLIATTTAREGATLQVGFGWISANGEIYRALSQLAWPGTAGVHVCVVWFSRHAPNASRVLDNIEVDTIPPSLVGHGVAGEPFTLAGAPWGFQGSDNSKGDCFVLTPSEEWFKRLSAAGSPFLRPYLTGDDITTGNYRVPPRWCVDCEDYSLEEVKNKCGETYRFLLEVASPVRTAEALSPYKGLISRWWQMWNHRVPLYRELRKQKLCIAIPMVAKHLDVLELPSSYVFTNKICVLRRPSGVHFATILSSCFEAWIVEHGGTRGAGRLAIVLSRGVQAFPLPQEKPGPETFGEEFCDQRDEIMRSRNQGFTDTYNCFHDQMDSSDQIRRLRAFRAELDQKVASAYGWSDLDLGHGFHTTKQGIRFTVSEPARRELLDRLLKLNHERYGEEVKEGLHEKGAKSKRGRGSETEEAGEPSLF